jgi:hypothetical protein
LAPGELNQNYSLLRQEYKREIKRLQKDCWVCFPAASPGKFPVADSFSAKDDIPADRLERDGEEFHVVDSYSAEEEIEKAAVGETEDESEIVLFELREDSENEYSDRANSSYGAETERVILFEDDTRRTFCDTDPYCEADLAEMQKKAGVCIYFKQGFCMFGDRCRNRHVLVPRGDLRDRLQPLSAEVKKMADLRNKLPRHKSQEAQLFCTAVAETTERVTLNRSRETIRCRVVGDWAHLETISSVSVFLGTVPVIYIICK